MVITSDNSPGSHLEVVCEKGDLRIFAKIHMKASICKFPKAYTLPRKVTGNTYLRSLQYKILNNILYLNEKLQQHHLAPSAILLVKILHVFSVIVQ